MLSSSDCRPTLETMRVNRNEPRGMYKGDELFCMMTVADVAEHHRIDRFTDEDTIRTCTVSTTDRVNVS